MKQINPFSDEVRMTPFAKHFVERAKQCRSANIIMEECPERYKKSQRKVGAEDSKNVVDFFAVKTTVETEGVIDLNTIVGSMHHGRYISSTWYTVLLNLGGRSSYLDMLEDTPDAFRSVSFYRDPIRFQDVDNRLAQVEYYNGKGYIVEGHNRLTIAKLLYECGIIENGIGPVSVTGRIVDDDALLRYVKIADEISANKNHRIFGVTLLEGSVRGRPFYKLRYANKHRDTFDVTCRSIEELEDAVAYYGGEEKSVYATVPSWLKALFLSDRR